MICREYYRQNMVGKLYKTFSDSGLKIKQEETGIIYDEAIDVESTKYTYTETDIVIENEDEEMA